VWSVADGTVTDITATLSGSGGRMIHIDNDDGTGADYLHLSDSTSFVTLGQHVTQGTKIALSGASGFDDDHYYGAHLHISYRTVTGHDYTNTDNIDFDALVRSLGLT
jgi:murein DD-endopeptidase